MATTEKILDMISGRRRDWLARLVCGGLGTLTPLYRMVIGWRNWRFDRAERFGLKKNSTLIQCASVPVISIGNLTTGGTGKTPLVIWVARYLRQRGWRVAVLSRGYGAPRGGQAATRNDEAIELEFRLPDVPHLQDANRVRMAEVAVTELETQVILLDDGFQHRQLHRDLDIVLIDATNPFGYDRLLPRGLLREPIASLRRADVIVLTRCELVGEAELIGIEDRVRRAGANAELVKVRTKPTVWFQYDGRQHSLEQFANKPVAAFCGIGNPSGFQQTLKGMSLDVKKFNSFDDHHAYTRSELEAISQAAKEADAEALVCTHKDLVKVGSNQIAGLPVVALLIELEFLEGRESLESRVERLLSVAILSSSYRSGGSDGIC